MSLLDKDLVDQELIEVKFKLMFVEMYERLVGGTFDIESLNKNPLSEYDICGVRWRIVGVNIVEEDGTYILNCINYVVGKVRGDQEKYKGCVECDKFLDKEYVKEFVNKMLDLYWDKKIYSNYVLLWKIGRKRGNASTIIDIPNILTRKKYDINEIFNAIERFATPDDKGLLDWIHKWCK